VSLGREIQKEIERLVLERRGRLSQVQFFRQLLNSLFERRQGMSYGSLISIAETYYGLTGNGRRPAVSGAYFNKAGATYAEILERDKSDSAFVPADREAGVRLRLVNCRKREGRFEDAFELIRAVLKELPRALDAQFEAASLLQEWGAKEPEKYLVAIDGITSGNEQSGNATGTVWGWAQIATRLQRILAAGSQSEDYRDKFAEARYNLAVCRQRFGLSQSVPAEKAEKLSMALQEIEARADERRDQRRMVGPVRRFVSADPARHGQNGSAPQEARCPGRRENSWSRAHGTARGRSVARRAREHREDRGRNEAAACRAARRGICGHIRIVSGRSADWRRRGVFCREWTVLA
jgi:tetratricopeptide (TPR) repeat protein